MTGHNSAGFHCVLQVAPSNLPESLESSVSGKAMAVIKLPRIETRFGCSFEDAAAALETLPRLFFELDGSFVWVVEKEARYQLDGSLYDDGERLLYVDLKGTCDPGMLDQFLACFGWPKQDLLFQIVQHGVYLSEAEFRSHYVAQ